MPIPSSVPNENAALIDRAVEWLRMSERDSRRLRWALVLIVLLYLICLAVFEAGPINHWAEDTFMLLDGGWRIFNGQMPYRDFYLVLGPLEYILTAAGMLLTNGSPQAIAVSNATFGITVGIWGWLLSRRRMPAVPALMVTAWLILTATCPTSLGSSPNVLSCAMLYNRHGYALLGLVLVECAFASGRSRFWGGVSSGVALILLAFLKLNFFGAAFLMLLATMPVKRGEMQRAWGILAGLACAFAAFIVYLRFAIFSFFSDMRLVIQARNGQLSFKATVAEIAGSAELLTLAIMTVIVALLVSRGKLWQRYEVRVILLGGIVIATGVLLKLSNCDERLYALASLWAIILIAQLTAAYPEAKEKLAISAVILLSLGGILVEFNGDAWSMLTLLRYQAPSVRSMGAGIDGRGMERLKFYEDLSDPQGSMKGDNGSFYVSIVNDGLELLEKSSTQQESVLTLSYNNPFSYILRRKPALGGSTWLALGDNVPNNHLLEASQVFGNADLMMVPHYPNVNQDSDIALAETYHPYLSAHFSFVASSKWWSLYRRNR
ncbi:MAG: hypothetical protein ABSC77_12860 [Terracidiphilus sp.]|jgi:hypothetical protein